MALGWSLLLVENGNIKGRIVSENVGPKVDSKAIRKLSADCTQESLWYHDSFYKHVMLCYIEFQNDVYKCVLKVT